MSSNAEDAPETTESLQAWIDSQDVIMAPWAREIDGATLDAGTIEDDRLVFANTPENQKLLEIHEHNIVHGYSHGHLVGILRRVESVKVEGEQIIIETSQAALQDLYLKLTSGAPFPMKVQVEQPLEPAADTPDQAPKFQQREMPLSEYWEIPKFDLLSDNTDFSGGFCYENKNGVGKWGPCDIAFSGVKAADDDPEGASGTFKAGFGMETTLKSKLGLNDGHVSINIHFYLTDAEKGLACMTKNHRLVRMMGERSTQLAQTGGIPRTDSTYRRYLSQFSSRCGHFDPANLDYTTYINNHLSQFLDSNGNVKPGQSEAYQIGRDHGPTLFWAHLNNLTRQVAGRQKTFDMKFGLNYNFALDPVRIFGQKQTTAGGLFQKTVEIPLRATTAVPIGPIIITMSVRTELRFTFDVTGRFGLEWTGETAPALGGNIDIGVSWDSTDGFESAVDFTGDSRFFGMPSFFGEATVELGASTPIIFAVKLYDGIGPTFTIEPYLEVGIGAKGSTNPDEGLSCNFELDIGTKAKIGGEVTVPYFGYELGKLEGLLFDRCKPNSGAALMPAWMTNRLPEWLCPISLEHDFCEDPNGGEPGDESDNSWVSLQVGNYSQTSQRRRPESSQAGLGLLDVDHIWLEKQSTGQVHFPVEVKGATVDPARLAYSGAHNTDENMRFHDLNEALSSAGEVVCTSKSGLTTRAPTEAEWQEYGLSILGQTVAEVKFPVEIESGDELVLDRHTYHYCAGGGVATVAIGDQAQAKYGPKLTSRAFSGGVLRLSVRKGDECQSGSNIICLPDP